MGWPYRKCHRSYGKAIEETQRNPILFPVPQDFLNDSGTAYLPRLRRVRNDITGVFPANG
jgi:hypothetical protein